MPDSIYLTVEFSVTPDELYRAWLNSDEHTAFTGSEAFVKPKVGTEFSAWEEHITGTNLELIPGRKIVQSWRTTEFNDDDPDSRLEIRFEVVPGGCKLILSHTELPDGDGPIYQDVWEDNYFVPMRVYFDTSDE
jgi:activator of HSP90 ATPase